MTVSGFWSICVIASFAGLCWLAFGIGGLACLIVGLIISQLDVGHIEVIANAQADATASRDALAADAVRPVGVDLLGRNVTPPPWHAVPIPPPHGVAKRTLTPSPLKWRRKQLPANVVRFPRRVS